MKEVLSALREWQAAYDAVNSAFWRLVPAPSVSLLDTVTESLAATTHTLAKSCDQNSLTSDLAPLYDYVARLQRLCRVARLEQEDIAHEWNDRCTEALIDAGNHAADAVLAIMAVASRPWDHRRIAEVDADEMQRLRAALESLSRQQPRDSMGSRKKQLRQQRDVRLRQLARSQGLSSPSELLKAAKADPEILNCIQPPSGAKLTIDICRNVLKPRGKTAKKIPRQGPHGKKMKEAEPDDGTTHAKIALKPVNRPLRVAVFTGL